ncbi:Flp family type IVb pilin [Pseudomonas sp. R2.Fl]|nr:Flp family type IVb pilin [Pseudomonas sp. R2.Fl]
MRRLFHFLSDRSGTTAVEYGILAALLSLAIVGGYSAVSNGVENTWTTLSDTYTEASDK